MGLLSAPAALICIQPRCSAHPRNFFHEPSERKCYIPCRASVGFSFHKNWSRERKKSRGPGHTLAYRETRFIAFIRWKKKYAVLRVFWLVIGIIIFKLLSSRHFQFSNGKWIWKQILSKLRGLITEKIHPNNELSFESRKNFRNPPIRDNIPTTSTHTHTHTCTTQKNIFPRSGIRSIRELTGSSIKTRPASENLSTGKKTFESKRTFTRGGHARDGWGWYIIPPWTRARIKLTDLYMYIYIYPSPPRIIGEPHLEAARHISRFVIFNAVSCARTWVDA